jgi:prepilin-type N-terminal cleavage/methylation domain-containing protein
MHTPHVVPRAGFSMVELMAVILILGLIGTIVVVSWQAVLPNQQLNTAVRNLSEVLHGTRSEAIARNREFRIYYDLDAERYWVRTPYRPGNEGGFATADDEPHLLTNETDLARNGVALQTVTIDDETYGDGVVWVRFDPLGASSQHTIVVRQELFERTFTLEVLPLTGEIRFHDGLFTRLEPQERDFQ